ncbi:MAG: type II toxin-antitoxin system RelE/ParE family toxin [Bacteroidales bacterium]|nr:type II toxin-antitoxin system RelE/ParE family toxin [Bacteroidales bacterium]
MFGKQAKDTFMEEVHQTAELLGEQPYLGKIEPYLAHRPVTYRSIVVNRLNKIVYRIDDDAIRIVAFWDTRREPKNQAEEVN